jgi:hypothetical protein
MAEQNPKDQDKKSQDEKKAIEAEKKAAEERAAAEGTPRPDPVGERNYALGAPIVRPEGEGTPGAMRQTLPPVVPTRDHAQPLRPDAERHATTATTPSPVGPETQRRTPVVPAVHPTTTRDHADAPDVRKTTTRVAEPETPRKK